MNGDDAYLRLVFQEAVESQDAWRKNPMLVWTKLYERVRDTEGGLQVLQEIELLRLEVAKLQAEVDRLSSQQAFHSRPLPVKD